MKSKVLGMLSLVAWPMVLGSCQVPIYPDQTKKEEVHIFPVDSDSLFYPYPEEKHSYWNLDKANKKLEVHLKAMDTQFHERKRKEVVVFVHGGMNTEVVGLNNAVIKLRQMSKDRPDVFPVFVTWDSGLLSSHARHMLGDENGVAYYSSSFARPRAIVNSMINFPTDILVGLAEGPRSSFRNGGKVLQGMDRLYDYKPDLFPTRRAYETVLEEQFGVTQKENRFTGFYKQSGKSVPWSVNLGSDDGPRWDKGTAGFVYFPLATGVSMAYQGMGRPAWENMVRRSATLVQMYPTMINYPNGYGKSAGVMARVLEQIAMWQQKDPDLKVTLIGHSMGTMVLNEGFRAMEDSGEPQKRLIPHIKVNRIIYMAAACSIKDFSNTAGRYLLKNPSTECYNLCLHPKRELNEEEPWPALRLAHSGSLLTWIDQMFESPREFEDRTMGSFENCIIAYQSMPATPRFHLKGFSDHADWSGKPSSGIYGPQKHGDFSSYNYWTDAFLQPAKPEEQRYYPVSN